MDFRKALAKALGICGERAADPTLLYYALCDAIGNNLQLKPQVEAFHHFNQTCQIIETMAKDPDPRMILTLLEKCKKQPDAPEKLCLKWIHTVFEIYYCAKHRKEEAEQVLKSLEQDFFEPEQEGLVLPKPKKTQPKNPPKKSLVAFRKAPAPQPMPFSNQPFPDDAYVYLLDKSPVLHISKQCPCLANPPGSMLYWSFYKTARFKDYLRINKIKSGMNTSADYNNSLSHVPPICPVCEKFIPQLPQVHPKIRMVAL